jgi:hypothetical protein
MLTERVFRQEARKVFREHAKTRVRVRSADGGSESRRSFNLSVPSQRGVWCAPRCVSAATRICISRRATRNRFCVLARCQRVESPCSSEHASQGVAASDSTADLATETTPTPKRGDLYDSRAPSARPLFHDFPAASRIIRLTITCRLRCELSKLIARVIAFAAGFPRRIKKDAKKREIKRGDRVFASGQANESATGDNKGTLIFFETCLESKRDNLILPLREDACEIRPKGLSRSAIRNRGACNCVPLIPELHPARYHRHLEGECFRTGDDIGRLSRHESRVKNSVVYASRSRRSFADTGGILLASQRAKTAAHRFVAERG